MPKEVRPGVSVKLVNPRPVFVERIRLHQLVAGTAEVAHPIELSLRKGVEFVQGAVDVIEEASVVLTDGQRIDFDYLIYAVGSTANRSIPGSEHADAVSDYASAQKTAQRVQQLGTGERVTVIGGGLTAIELASEIADGKPDAHVSLVSAERLFAGFPEASRSHVIDSLTALGVELREGKRVEAITESSVELSDGTELASACTILAAGFTAPDLAQRSGLSVDANRRLKIDLTLRSIDNPRIFGAGDAVTVAGSPHLRAACATAGPQGLAAANNVLAELRGEERDEFSLGFVAQCVSLGRHAALLQVVNADDSPKERAFKGRSAVWIKEAICKGTYNYLTLAPGKIWRAGPKAKELTTA